MRKSRFQFQGALFYVVVEGNWNGVILRDEDDYGAYLRLLGGALESGRMNLYAYSLLPDQVQLVLEQGEDQPLSRFMRSLWTSFSAYHSRKYGAGGPFFRQRYKSVLADKADYLKDLILYTLSAPVQYGLSPKLLDHPWSACGRYSRVVGWRPLEKSLASSRGRFLEARERADRVRALLANLAIEGDRLVEIEEARSGSILGSLEFKRRLAQGKAGWKKGSPASPAPEIEAPSPAPGFPQPVAGKVSPQRIS